MSNLKISTLKINRAKAVRKRACLFDLVKVKFIIVMFVQETHSNNDTDWKKGWDGEVITSRLGKNSGGVAQLFSKTFLPQLYVVEEVVKGKLLVVKARYESYRLKIKM